MKKVQISMPLRYLINGSLLALLVAAAALLSGSGALSGYHTKILLAMGINIMLAVSLNVITGYLGQLPLGHSGFMAVGAYTGGILLKSLEIQSLTGILGALLAAGLMAGFFGFLIGVPALRLKGDYLAIITLGFGEIIRVVLTNIDSVLSFKLTYGASGLKRIPKFSTVTLVLLCVILTCTFIHMVMKSRHGRAILAIRENEIAAEACGIPVTFYKVMAFVISSFFAGVAGCLYAGYIGSLQPGGFSFMKSIEILVMVVLGGRGSMLGSVLAACVLTVLPEAMRGFDDLRMVMYSLVLIVMMLFRPEGLLGSYDFSLSRLLERGLTKLKGGRKA